MTTVGEFIDRLEAFPPDISVVVGDALLPAYPHLCESGNPDRPPVLLITDEDFGGSSQTPRRLHVVQDDD